MLFATKLLLFHLCLSGVYAFWNREPSFFEKLTGSASNGWSFATEKSGSWWSYASNNLPDTSTIGKTAQNGLSSVWSYASNNVPDISTIGETAQDGLSSVWSFASNNLPDTSTIGETAQNGLSSVWNYASDNIPDISTIGETAQNGLSSVWNYASNNLPDTLTIGKIAQDGLSSVWNYASDNVPDISTMSSWANTASDYLWKESVPIREKASQASKEVRKHVLSARDSLSEKLEEFQDRKEPIIEKKDVFSGATAGSLYNWWNYAVETSGRATNMLVIRDKTSISSLGNKRWLYRLDKPHGNTPFYHINVNRAITKVADPHHYVSAPVAWAARGAGTVLKYVEKAAPALFMASVAVESYDVIDTWNQEGSSKAATKAAFVPVKFIAAGQAASYGAAIGTYMFPGVGTLIGGILGATAGSSIVSIGQEYMETMTSSLPPPQKHDNPPHLPTDNV